MTSAPLASIGMNLLDPKNDFVFKKLLAESPDLLAALINAVRSPRPAITVVEVLNPAITPEDLQGKFIVLDVLAEDAQGRRHNVEMQTRPHPAWGSRSIYYLSRALAQQLDAGQDYGWLRPAIGIHLLDFALYDDEALAHQATWCFELRDQRKPGVRLGDELELHLVELPKARRLPPGPGPYALDRPLSAWIDFFTHWQDEARMAELNEPAVRQALNRLQEISADEQTRQRAFIRARALSDERTARREERELGRAEGHAEGRAQGRLEGEADLLRRLLVARFGPLPLTIDQQIEAATPAELQRWADRLLGAESLSAVITG